MTSDVLVKCNAYVWPPYVLDILSVFDIILLAPGTWLKEYLQTLVNCLLVQTDFHYVALKLLSLSPAKQMTSGDDNPAVWCLSQPVALAIMVFLCGPSWLLFP